MNNGVETNSNTKAATGTVISFGTVLATVISYTTWKSVSWAILYGILGWIYVIYYLIKY